MVRECQARPVVGYLRVSTLDQADRDYGLDVQRERVATLCRAEPLELLASFTDVGVSGTTSLHERPGLRAALNAIKGGEASALVVARFDRLARCALQAVLIEQEFAAAGADVLYGEGLDGRNDELALVRTSMHAAIDRYREQGTARLRAGRAAKAKAGGYAYGRPPIGFRGVQGFLVRHEEEAEVVRWVFERIARDAWSTRRVARVLTAEQTLGRRWHATQIRRMIRRAEYKSGPAESRIVPVAVWRKANAAVTARMPV
jgi:DNA invertase Pin-like site-specific DNA recombinase